MFAKNMRPQKIMFKALIALFLVESVLSQAVLVGDTEKAESSGRAKQYMKTSGVILDVCVYEREFVPSEGEDKDNAPWTSGTLIQRAVVTGVHRGNTKVGTKIEIVEIVIDPPEFLKKFRSVVEGELLTYFYYGEELPEPKNGKHIVNHNQMYFDRDKDQDVKAFLKSLDPIKSEQDGADQPAAAPASKQEGNENPKPVAEVRPE
jgi:hypothetical protein